MNIKFKRGMTLIEVLVVSALTGLIGLGIVSIQRIMNNSQLLTFTAYLDVDETNRHISRMTREIRNIQYGDNAAYPLERAQDQEMIFYSDVDFDGNTEKVRYSLNGTNFERGVIEPVGYPALYPLANEKVQTLSDSVRNGEDPIFYYYNGDWPEDVVNNPLPSPVRLSETKMMKLILILNSTEDESKNYTLESYVQIRALKDNL